MAYFYEGNNQMIRFGFFFFTDKHNFLASPSFKFSTTQGIPHSYLVLAWVCWYHTACQAESGNTIVVHACSRCSLTAPAQERCREVTFHAHLLQSGQVELQWQKAERLSTKQNQLRTPATLILNLWVGTALRIQRPFHRGCLMPSENRDLNYDSEQ